MSDAKNFKDLIGEYDVFLKKMLDLINEAGIKLEDIGFKEIDHIAYHFEDLERYQKFKPALSEFADLFNEIIVSDRPVGVYKLKTPIRFDKHVIEYLEIIAPDAENAYKEGLAHIEMVVDVPLEEIAAKYPHLQFKLKRPESINPELKLKFSSSAEVKFHRRSIVDVILMQREKGITQIGYN